LITAILSLKKSYSQEKKLIKKCRELNSEIINNASKVQTALKLSSEDQNTIISLKKEIDKAWKMVDSSHEKSIKLKETITQLKEEITNLTSLVQKGAGLNAGNETMMKELLKSKEELQIQNDEYENQIKINQERNTQLHQHISELELNITNYKKEINELKENIILLKSEQLRDIKRKERFDKEIIDLKK